MISDHDLLLYHYGDGLDAAERARIAAALRTQPALAERLSSLVKQLDAAASTPEVPVPMHIQRRWEAALDHAVARSDSGRRAPPSWLERLRWPAIAAAALVIVVAVGLQPGSEKQLPAPSATVAQGTPAAAESGVRWHLVSTQRQLDELQHARGDERADLIAAIIAQNRLYAAAAERAGDARLARALRAFNPILEELAAAAPESGAADGELAQLSFELRVMQARLATPPDSSGNARSLAL